MRCLARRIGVLNPNGAGVLSYLLFESGYCRRLIDLGFSDVLARRPEILHFLGYEFDRKSRTPQDRPRAGTGTRAVS
jgi:NTE family protein